MVRGALKITFALQRSLIARTCRQAIDLPWCWYFSRPHQSEEEHERGAAREMDAAAPAGTTWNRDPRPRCGLWGIPVDMTGIGAAKGCGRIEALVASKAVYKISFLISCVRE
jgi:hypothetical protein